MKHILPGVMRAATRLTQAGRLAEATALLQRMLNGGSAFDTPPDLFRPGPPIIDVVTDPRPASLVEPVQPLPAVALRPAIPTPEVEPSPGAQFSAGVFHNAAGSRPYKLYVPSSYRPDRPAPLIVMLHGCTQSPDDFAAGTRMNDAAEAHGCLVVYPGQTSAANLQRCWNWFSAADQQRDGGEPSLIAGITRHVMGDYAIDPARVYVAGLSAGGAAAAIMGAAYPDLYAAVGVHSGLACGAARDVQSAFAAMNSGHSTMPVTAPRHSIPTIVFHGDRDNTVNPRNGDAVAAQVAPLTKRPVRTEEGRVPAGHAYRRTLQFDADGRVAVEQWTIIGAGHAWSGGSPAGSFTDPRGPDATAEMLRFFLEHPRIAPQH